jgi:tetratricopeptide (TPR) repeat protein
MDPTHIDALVQRLVTNPHDAEALSYAHQGGAADPKSYALLLERVGAETKDPAYASHWLSEAANVWSTTLGDAHRAARVLMQAIDRDPTAQTAADRLAQLYREKGDVKALVALLERRAKALAPLSSRNPEIRTELATMHEELGRLWGESLQQPKKAVENFRRACELEPSNTQAIYSAREIYKSLGQWDDVFAMYSAELAVEPNPERQIALLRDEASARRTMGDLAGASRAVARAREIDEKDTALQQEYASLVVDRIAAGEGVPGAERKVSTALLVGLAETYDGEHGLAYSAGALDLDPGHDRALQLYAHYAHAMQRHEDLAARYLAYVEANPQGTMAADARWLLAGSYEGAGQADNAIQMLEPLRALGDEQATAKLRDLYARAGRAMPSVPPAAPPPRANPPSPGADLPHAAPPAGGPSAASGSRMLAESGPERERGSRMLEESGPEHKRGPHAATHRPAVGGGLLQGVLDEAQTLASQGNAAEAYVRYREVLESDPAHPEALAWTEDYLRTKRDYASLRDMLLAAVRAPGASAEARKERLREVAGLCEGNLRDADGAVLAYKQLLAIDRSDDSARQSLARLLERSQRWNELANVLEQEATAEADFEKKIGLEKRLATLHEHKRGDFAAAAEAWSRIANLTPEDDLAVMTAAGLFEKAGAGDRAAQVIAEGVQGVTDPLARGKLLEHLGALRDKLGDKVGAADAYADAAESEGSHVLWEAAERGYVAAERWERAGHAAVQHAQTAADAKQQAQSLGRAADYFERGGDESATLAHLERAAHLDPTSEEYAGRLTERYTRAEKWSDLVALLVHRGERLVDKGLRVATRRQAAHLLRDRLNDVEAAREMWLKVLEDGDNPEALENLIQDALQREDHTEATTLLRRLGGTTRDRGERARIALREAEILAEGIGDVDTAISRYESILVELDPACRPALQAIADLQEARDNPVAAADALERELALVSEPSERGPIAGRLSHLYEQLGDPARAIRSLEIVRKADPEDFEALARLSSLCERTQDYARLAELLAERIEIEGDPAEAGRLTRQLASVLADKLDRGDEGLAALGELADAGDEDVRAAYVELGDRLGWRGIVATKLVEWWFEARPSPERLSSLRGAFERFAEMGRDEDAVRVACEIVRSKGADAELAERLEELSIKTHDFDALAIAHDLLVRELTGTERAYELVRQAEARAKAGAPRAEAVQHGEAGLTSVPASEAEELLGRLAAIAETGGEVVDLYERQISRCKAPADRMKAFARAAQVAASNGQVDRARGFFELALSGTPTDETLALLEQAARDGDQGAGGDALRRALGGSMASGGQGARDGGKTRGALLRRAASVVYGDLGDVDQAFTWLGDALIAHVDPATLDALDELARAVGDPGRAEATLTRALGEVFDGPLVRQLFARRAKLRREQLDDSTGAAADFKKLHDLSPHDQAVMDELSSLLTELGDYRGMVQLYEDQILRGKDMSVRAELARKVARMWEEQLADPREAADAWRRVLRMKQGDAEATAGLERAKSNMLKRPDPGAEREAYAPPKLQTAPPPEAKRDAVAPAAGAAEPAPTPAPPPARTEAEDRRAESPHTALAAEAGGTRDDAARDRLQPDVPVFQRFRESDDDVTLNAPYAEAFRLDKAPPAARATPVGRVFDDLEAVEHIFAPPSGDEPTATEAPAELRDSTLTRPDLDAAGAAAPTGEHAVTSHMTGIPSSMQANAEGVPGNAEGLQSESADFEEEVIIADDLAEMIEAGDGSDEAPKNDPKRSVPPPLPSRQ